MADTSLNIGLQLAGLGNTVAGLQQTTQAINQVTAAQRQLAQGTGVARDFSSGVLGGLGIGQFASASGAIAGIFGFTRGLITAAGRTRDLAEQLGLTTDQFQRLETAAADTGVNFGRLVSSLGQLEQQRQTAAEGNEKLRAAFAALGISLADLNDDTLGAVDLQNRLAQATASGTQAQRDAVRVLLGAQGARLLPALQAARELEQAGLASPAALASVDEYGKFWERTWRRIKNGGIEAFGTLNAALQEFFREWLGDKGNPVAAADEERDRADFAAFRERALANAAEYRRREAAAEAAGDFEGAQRFGEAARRSAADYGMTFDEYRRLQAPAEAGPNRFEDLAAQRQLGELEKQRADNAEKRLRAELAGLPVAERRSRLEAMRDAERDIAAGDPDALRAAQAEGRALDLEAQLAGLKGGPSAPLPANAWERMGLTSGFGFSPDRGQEAVQVARETQRATQQLAVSMEAMRTKLENGTLMVSFPL